MFVSRQIEPPDFSDAPVGSSLLLPWLWYFIRPNRNLFWLLTANRLGRQIFFIGIQPLVIAKIVALFETGEAYRYPHKVWLWVILFAGLSTIVYLLLLLCAEEAKLHDRVARSARLLGLKHLNQLSVDWHEQADSGSKLYKIMNGATGIQALLQLYFLSMLEIVAGFVGTGIATFGMGLPWSIIALFGGMMITYCACAWWMGFYIARGFDLQNQHLEKLIGKVYEFVNAALTIRIFNLGPHIGEQARSGEQAGHEQISKLYLLYYVSWIVLNFVGLTWVLGILKVGINLTLSHAITVAALALIGYQALRLWEVLEGFTQLYNQVTQHSSSAKRLIELLRQPVRNDASEQLMVTQGEINFNNVSFAYSPNKNIIEGLNLSIGAGEKIGIVGHSGAGKSTLVKLLLRFYDPQGGSILIDNQNVHTVSRESLYQNIAVIPQDVSLFNYTVLDNIRYGRLDASDGDVIEAAKRAFADEFITELPEGYHTIIGEQGLKLSGGQRQRIAIARAILKQAPILILDEATSALDSESERLVQSSLRELFCSHTVIAIAHRLSTLLEMDRLVVLKEGRIIESGTHQELLRQQRTYAKLWETQNHGNI